MNPALKRFLSKRAIVILLVAVLVLSAFNTYLIFTGIQSANRTNALAYDFVLSQDGNSYQLKNMLTGNVVQQPFHHGLVGQRISGVRAHAAGVGASIAFAYAFVVL